VSKAAGLLVVAAGALAVPAIAVLALVAMTGSAIACSTVPASTLAATAPVPAPARLWIALTHANCPDLPDPWIAALMAQESKFRPAARATQSSHADANGGTRGLFQLTAGVWRATYGATWEADLDHNGTPDVDDPDIHAAVAGDYLCARLNHVRRLRTAHPQWPSTTALTELDALTVTHTAGESSLHSYPDIALGASQFLADVRERTTAWTAASRSQAAIVDVACLASLGSGGAVVVPAGTRQDIAHAVRTSLDHVGETYGWHNRCDRLACRAYGFANSGYPTATAHWRTMLATGHAHVRDRCPPVGAFVYWAASQPAGHVALVVQSDPACDPNRIKVVSNDVLDSHTGNDGGVYLVTLSQIEDGFMNASNYRGWSDPVCAGSQVSTISASG
jgi:hypothetical protein